MKTTTYLGSGGGVQITICDKPEPTKSDLTRAALTIAVTAYDYGIRLRAARNSRVYHNPFALALYSEAIDRVVASLAFEGVTLRMALTENFTGHMLNYLLGKVAR
jgi:uncharacterized glyoxalase superfamily protein PhnB